jgi:hypothetical protein
MTTFTAQGIIAAPVRHAPDFSIDWPSLGCTGRSLAAAHGHRHEHDAMRGRP